MHGITAGSFWLLFVGFDVCTMSEVHQPNIFKWGYLWKGGQFTLPVIAAIIKQCNYCCKVGAREKERQISAKSTRGAAKCGDLWQLYPGKSLSFIRCQMSTVKNSQSPLFRDAYHRALLWISWVALPRSRVHSCLAVCTQRQFCCGKNTPDKDAYMCAFSGQLINPTQLVFDTAAPSLVFTHPELQARGEKNIWWPWRYLDIRGDRIGARKQRTFKRLCCGVGRQEWISESMQGSSCVMCCKCWPEILGKAL